MPRRRKGEATREHKTAAFIRPKAFGDAIYDLLLTRMMSLEIRPGERLSVDKLAREFQVSPTPIREALGRLEAVGLVSRVHLIGYSAAPRLTTKQFQDLFHLRLMIEPELARLAALNADAKLADALNEMIAGMSEAAEHGQQTAYDRFARFDSRFHELIAVASGNLLIRDVLARLNVHIHIFRAISDGQVAANSIAEHREILAAIAGADGDSAEKAMRRHIRSAHDGLSASFGLTPRSAEPRLPEESRALD